MPSHEEEAIFLSSHKDPNCYPISNFSFFFQMDEVEFFRGLYMPVIDKSTCKRILLGIIVHLQSLCINVVSFFLFWLWHNCFWVWAWYCISWCALILFLLWGLGGTGLVEPGLEAREEKRFYGYPMSTRHRDPITNEVFTSGLLVTCITYYIIYTAETQATRYVWNSLWNDCWKGRYGTIEWWWTIQDNVGGQGQSVR